MNYLGLDYGLTHLGVAISDGFLAAPLTTISTVKASKLLPLLVNTHHVEKIVIGRPDKSLKLEFNKFINLLKIACPAKPRVHPKLLAKEDWRSGENLLIVDETLSSHDARQKLLHTTRSRRKTLEHSAAAAIILQSWLDSKNIH